MDFFHHLLLPFLVIHRCKKIHHPTDFTIGVGHDLTLIGLFSTFFGSPSFFSLPLCLFRYFRVLFICLGVKKIRENQKVTEQLWAKRASVALGRNERILLESLSSCMNSLIPLAYLFNEYRGCLFPRWIFKKLINLFHCRGCSSYCIEFLKVQVILLLI